MAFCKIGVLQGLIFVGRDVFRNVFQLAVQYAANIIQRGGVQGFVLAQFIDGGAGNVVVMNEGIGRLIGILQRYPEAIINYHTVTPPFWMFSFYVMVLILTIVVKKTIIWIRTGGMRMKKWIFRLLIAMLLIVIIPSAMAASGGGSFKKYTFSDTPKSESVGDVDATVGEKNALRVGEDYLAAMGFSYEGLIDQLEYEGFTHEEAVYACDILFERSALPMKKGSTGSKVEEIQQRLIELGFLNGGADGIFGSGTEGAVKSFQDDRGLEVTGIVDEETYAELYNEAIDGYSFIGKISLAMQMDLDTLWESSSSAAFGAVTVLMDITAENIPEMELEGIGDVFLAKLKIKGEETVLAYYYFRDTVFVCAIFNPATGEITAEIIDYNTTPKQAMLAMHSGGVVDDYQVIDMDDIAEILGDLLG